MQSILNTLLLGLLGLSAVGAAPTVERHPLQKRVFTVDRVKNPNFVKRDGPKELFKVYRKYSMPVPKPLLDSMRANGQGQVAVVASHRPANGTSQGGASNGIGTVVNTPVAGDLEYLAPVTIGGQTLNLDFDSGSSDLWVFSRMLPAASTAGHTLFDAAKSKTFKQLQGSTWTISYGDGSGAAGVVGTDTVTIGGVTVTGQAVEMATAVSSSFVEDTANNGLVGLAYSKLNTVKPQQQKTFFDNVIPSLAEPVFTADLRAGAPGAYQFGAIDKSKFVGDMAWVPVNTTNGFWQFSTSAFAVGTGPAQAVATGQAIADTGTTLMIAAPEVVNAYYSQVQGAQNSDQVGGFIFPCNAQLPDLMVDVGGAYTAKISGKDINFANVQDNTCFGGLQTSTGTGGLQIWGDIMFKSQFVAFNGGNNSLGFAQHA